MTDNLPYTKRTSFDLNGHLHDDEQSALRAAITQTIGNAGIASKVLAEARLLAPLLVRAVELDMMPPLPRPILASIALSDALKPLPEPPYDGKAAAELAALDVRALENDKYDPKAEGEHDTW